MKRISLILITIILSQIADATTYYLSLKGNDSYEGTKPAITWKSIERINKARIMPGDSVLFQRGEIFRGNLIAAPGSSDGYITYGAYGSGEKPKIYGSLQRNKPSDWTSEGNNIWVSAMIDADAGNIIFNNEAFCGVKVWDEKDLNAQNKFWYDEDRDLVKLYSVFNPGIYYSEIEIALRKNIINEGNSSYVVFENLDLRYGAGHGIGGSKTHHIRITGMEFSFIGGGDQYGGSRTVRFGNGVEFWNDAHDNIVEKCTFNQIYDAAMTAQGSDTAGFEVYNIYFRNNIVNNSEYSFEFWERFEKTYAHDIYFENNTCLNAGGGWGHSQRPNPNGTHLMLYNTSSRTERIYLRNNIFCNSTDWSVRWTSAMDVNKYIIDYNCYFESDGTVAYVANKKYDFLTQWKSYQGDTGHDSHSITTDPLINHDYSLKTNSPCIDAGLKTDLPYTGKAPDIGAFEFTPL